MRRHFANPVEIQHASRNRCNGDVKMIEFKLQKFPWKIFLALWVLMAFFAVSIPYLARSIPPTHRTDIKWWMSGVVYQIPAPVEQQDKYFKELSTRLDELHYLGIRALRVSEFFKSTDGAVTDFFSFNPAYGNMEDFEAFMDALVKREMRLIVDVPLSHTSTSHNWFNDDREFRSRDSVYCWKQATDTDGQEYVESHWQRDDTSGEFYQHVVGRATHALINYASNTARSRMQHVLGYWLQHGVSGFLLIDYDKLHFTPIISSNQHNHIQFEQPKLNQLRGLVNLTRSLRAFMTEQQNINDPDEPTETLLALDISWQDEKSWGELYNAGANLILNNDRILSRDFKITGEFDPFELREQVRGALLRVPQEHAHSWRVCDEKTTMTTNPNDNTRNLVNMAHLLLPGAAFICQQQIHSSVEEKPNDAQHFRELMEWRLEAAMSWGDTQLGYVDRNTFSFVRYSFAKMYPRYIVIMNFDTRPRRHSFSMIRDDLIVPDVGTLRYFTCPDTRTPSGDRHVVNTIVHLNDTLVQPRCGLLVELKLRASL